MIKVLIVEDSAVSRQLIKKILETDPGIKVVAEALNGIEAIEAVQKERPDVITMDINMPGMNGMEATRVIMETLPVPIIIVSASYEKQDVEKSFMAMEAGAVAILEKPFGFGHPDHSRTAEELLLTVKLMSEVKVVKRWPAARRAVHINGARSDEQRDIRLVAIGASTGGPPVLQTILAGLEKGFPFPITAVQHISRGFLQGLVEWLRQTTGHPVHIASHGEALLPGHVYFAPEDLHLGISNGGRAELSGSEPVNGIRPSVSYLFSSASRAYGGKMAGVLLTGMGRDGAEELKGIKEKGGITMVQDKESSVVYGMPGEAVRIGAATHVLTPEKIAGELEAMAGMVRRGGDRI